MQILYLTKKHTKSSLIILVISILYMGMVLSNGLSE